MGSVAVDPLYLALYYYRTQQVSKCVSLCTEYLEHKPFDEAFWSLKTRALTAKVLVDELENEWSGIADLAMDDNALMQLPRPGTSLRTGPPVMTGTASKAFRPTTQSGRPASGVVRPGAQGQEMSMERQLKTARTAKTARPVSAATGRHVRLGTASMAAIGEGQFINVARLNVGKYAGRGEVGKALFEFLFHHENAIRAALDLASQALEMSKFSDWFWKLAVAKCYYRLTLFRECEKQLKSGLRQFESPDLFQHLARVYLRLDQPMAALEVYKTGLESFKEDVDMLKGMARVHEALGNLDLASRHYKRVLREDAMHVEAMACIGLNHFYSDQPEVALRFYTRILQLGVHSTELFNNLGLCCFFAQQFDLTLNCMERALVMAKEDNELLADVWYNVSHMAISLGDMPLATQCLRLAIANNPSHAEAFNNLGVIEMRRRKTQSAAGLFQTAANVADHVFEPVHNLAALRAHRGEMQAAFLLAQRADHIFNEHQETKELIKQLQTHFLKL